MFEALLKLAFGVFFLSNPGGVTSPVDRSLDLAPPECTPAAWVKPLVLNSKGIAEAVLTSECTFVSAHGGDYGMLEEYGIARGTKESTIHQGPIEETYEGMPSKFFDVTTRMTMGDPANYADIRQDVHVATDRAARLILATFSTQIQGAGQGKYLKKADLYFETVNLPTAGNHKSTILMTAHLQKPMLVPGSMFLNEIKTKLPVEFEENRNELMPEVQNNL